MRTITESVNFMYAKIAKEFTEFNSILKDMYKGYVCLRSNKGFQFVPASFDAIKEPYVFNYSIAEWFPDNITDGYYPIQMAKYVIDPVMFNKALRDRNYILERSKEKLYLEKEYKEKTYYVGNKVDIATLKDIKRYEEKFHYLFLNNKTNEPYILKQHAYVLTKKEVELMKKYKVVTIHLDNEVRLDATLKLFPAIKKADTIVIFYYPIMKSYYNTSINNENIKLDKSKLANIYIIDIHELKSSEKSNTPFWDIHHMHTILNY